MLRVLDMLAVLACSASSSRGDAQQRSFRPPAAPASFPSPLAPPAFHSCDAPPRLLPFRRACLRKLGRSLQLAGPCCALVLCDSVSGTFVVGQDALA